MTSHLPPVDPRPPSGVRLDFGHGNEVSPMAVDYVGWDGETHMWRATFPAVLLDGGGYSARIGVLPPHTSVVFHRA